MVILHHNDNDGRASAAIVLEFDKSEGERVCIEMNYSKRLPIEHINKDEKVYIVDFSFENPDDWAALLNKTKDVIWIDHHKTAISRFKEFDKSLNGIRRVGTAACELTWEHFKGNKAVPYAIQLIGDYDIWAFHLQGTLKFHYGLNALTQSPYDNIWSDLLRPDKPIVDGIISDGAIALRTIDAINKDAISNGAFECDILGYKAIVLNTTQRSSNVFKSVNKRYDVMSVFSYDDGKWTASFYTEPSGPVDVSKIAEQFGGGGHKGAAGCVTKECPLGILYK